MAEYLPVYAPGQKMTTKISATTTAGQLLMVTGDGTQGPCGAAAKNMTGWAGQSGVANDYITYYVGGVQHAIASGAITAGDPVICGAAGTVVSAATPALGQKVGVALTTAADGAQVRVLHHG